MTNFAEAAKTVSKKTVTQNGAECWNTTSNALVDLFATIGILRDKQPQDIINKFTDAFEEDALLAVKMAFYARNIRGGLGERKTFRTILTSLAKTNPDIVIKNLENVLLFGRADDLYCLINTPCEQAMWHFVKKQFREDLVNYDNGKPISLLAKWLKSVNTSSVESNKLGRLTARALGYKVSDYRKILAKLRKYTNVVEVNLSAKTYDKINYAQVPSRAMTIYRNAFENRDAEHFEAYKSSLIKGETKINASTLYPYDLIERLSYKYEENSIVEQQWKALPNYVTGENNILVMADTSGSMSGRPMCTSVGLAIYFAERNKGAYKDMFMTFTDNPHLVTLKGKYLARKYAEVTNYQYVGYNTNFERAFQEILRIAKAGHVAPEEMPVSLVVISDMQFDECVQFCGCSKLNWDFYTEMKQQFEQAGYVMPNIVFWNCSNCTKDTFHAQNKYQGVQMFSGQSVATFKNVLANIGLTSYEAMLNTLNDPMYDCVTI